MKNAPITFYYKGQMSSKMIISLSIKSTLLQYGAGFFETLKIDNGKCSLKEEHLDRIKNSFFSLFGPIKKWPTYKKILIEEMNSFIYNYLSCIKTQLSSHICLKLKLMIWPLSQNNLHSTDDLEHLMIIESYLKPSPLVLGIADAKISSYFSKGMAAHKHINYMPSIYLKNDAKKQKLDDVIRSNDQGSLLEISNANIFTLHGNILSTPPLGEILPGITRARILRTAASSFKCYEKSLRLDDLLKADHLFVSNSLVELLPVKQLKDRHYCWKTSLEKLLLP